MKCLRWAHASLAIASKAWRPGITSTRWFDALNLDAEQIDHNRLFAP